MSGGLCHTAFRFSKRLANEEAFRDLKNHRWGLALRYARSTRTERLEILLLLALLAFFVTWLVGLAARTRQWERHFQANTERRRPVLSVPYLGMQVLASAQFILTIPDLQAALTQLNEIVHANAEYN